MIDWGQRKRDREHVRRHREAAELSGVDDLSDSFDEPTDNDREYWRLRKTIQRLTLARNEP